MIIHNLCMIIHETLTLTRTLTPIKFIRGNDRPGLVLTEKVCSSPGEGDYDWLGYQLDTSICHNSPDICLFHQYLEDSGSSGCFTYVCGS